MNSRLLGRSKLRISCLTLGTVSLGADYGIRQPGNCGLPPHHNSIQLIRRAVAAGVNLFDTAPAYGSAETVLGEALIGKPEVLVATKVPTAAADGTALDRAALHRSLADSRKNLRRQTLDLIQIHNATVADLLESDLPGWLEERRSAGEVRFLGTSVYDEEAALAAITHGGFDFVQIPYNLLDRRIEKRVLPLARREKVGLLLRSPLLKGALTPKARWLPSELEPLKVASDAVRQCFCVEWEQLPQMALRFALSAGDQSVVLLGVRTTGELEAALEALEAGTLGARVARAGADVKIDERWLNPTGWPIP